MNDELRFQCGVILHHYGEEHQQEKSIEEMAELISAIKHNDRKNYIDELADVSIMVEQLFQALSFEEQQKFIVTIHSKISRQLSRIHEEASSDIRYANEFTKEFWERKVNEPPTDKCVDEAGWEDFGKKAMKK